MACNRKDLETSLATKPPEYFRKKNLYICSKHFEAKCFRNVYLPSQGLLPGSLPTIKLYSQSEISQRCSLAMKQIDNLNQSFLPEIVLPGNTCELSNTSNTNITDESNLDNSEKFKSLPETASSANVCDPLNPLKMEIVDECNLANSKKLLPKSILSRNINDPSNMLDMSITDKSNSDNPKRQIQMTPGSELQFVEKLITKANRRGFMMHPSSPALSGSTGQTREIRELEIQNMHLRTNIAELKKFIKKKNNLLCIYRKQKEIIKQKLKAFKGHVSLDKEKIITGANNIIKNVPSYANSNISQMTMHKLRRDDSRPLSRDKCTYATNVSSSFRRHSLMHKETQNFVCDICGYATNDKSSLKSHLSFHETKKTYICDKCNFATNTKKIFESHLDNQVDTKKFDSNRFYFETNTRPHMKAHAVTHNKPKRFSCDKCTYATNNSSYMNAQPCDHKKENAFDCDMCSLATGRRSYLNECLHTHENVKKIVPQTIVNNETEELILENQIIKQTVMSETFDMVIVKNEPVESSLGNEIFEAIVKNEVVDSIVKK